MELEKPDADLGIAFDGFPRGRKIDIWARADGYIDHLMKTATRIRTDVDANTLDAGGAELHIEELHQTNSMLAPLENEFSRVLSEAARSTVLMPLIVMFATAAIMPGVAFTLSRRLMRSNETVQAALGSRKSEDFYVQREDRDRLIQTLHRDSSARDREIQLQDTQGNKFWILMSSQRISY